MELVDFAEWLKGRLDMTGCSVVTAAEVLGVTPGAVYSWLQGRSVPRPGHMYRVASLVGATNEERLIAYDACARFQIESKASKGE